MRVAETASDRATLGTQTVKRPPIVATWVALLTYCCGMPPRDQLKRLKELIYRTSDQTSHDRARTLPHLDMCERYSYVLRSFSPEEHDIAAV